MKRIGIFYAVLTVMLSVFADDAAKTSEPDWDKICFAITNACVREDNYGATWMAIATTKLQHGLTSEQMLLVFKRCIEGLGDAPRESLACRRIVESMSGLCDTNALPYVEYLIENDRREGVSCAACRQLLWIDRDLDRSLLFVEKLLDSKSGHDDSFRIAVYRELCSIWKKASIVGDLQSRGKLTSFFERRSSIDKDFDRLAPPDFRATRRNVTKAEGLDWDGICYAISNVCVRSRHPEPAWGTIAAVKVKYKLNADQMLEAFKRCIGGLGNDINETMACERIVHCLSGECGTNALPYVEYLIENDKRDGVVDSAFRQLVQIESELDRKLLFAEKILDPKSGRGDCSRIVVYQELRDIWAQIARDGTSSDRVKMASFFEKRKHEDALFKSMAPQDFRPPKKDDEIEWERVCYVISNMFSAAKPPRDGYMTLVHARNSYGLSKSQMMVAIERCLDGLGRDGREQKASELIVSYMGEVCGTNAVPCLERIASSDGREPVANCAFRELMKLKQFSGTEKRPADLGEFRAAKQGDEQ